MGPRFEAYLAGLIVGELPSHPGMERKLSEDSNFTDDTSSINRCYFSVTACGSAWNETNQMEMSDIIQS